MHFGRNFPIPICYFAIPFSEIKLINAQRQRPTQTLKQQTKSLSIKFSLKQKTAVGLPRRPSSGNFS